MKERAMNFVFHRCSTILCIYIKRYMYIHVIDDMKICVDTYIHICKYYELRLQLVILHGWSGDAGACGQCTHRIDTPVRCRWLFGVHLRTFCFSVHPPVWRDEGYREPVPINPMNNKQIKDFYLLVRSTKYYSEN